MKIRLEFVSCDRNLEINFQVIVCFLFTEISTEKVARWRAISATSKDSITTQISMKFQRVHDTFPLSITNNRMTQKLLRISTRLLLNRFITKKID